MQIFSKFLFGAVVVGAMLETAEVVWGVCQTWQQEYLLLAGLLLASLVARGHELLTALAAALVLGFYSVEAYEIWVESELCSPMAAELNPLLAANLLALAGLALGHQLNDSARSK